MPQNIVSLQHVFVSRGGATVLHDINLTLAAGEHLAILGPNGCGKSTLLKTITCELYPLTVGPNGEQTSVSIFGRQRWDLTQLRQRLGVVSAELPGKPTLGTTGFDAILTGFFSSSTLWPNLKVTDAMRSRAEILLRQVDGQSLRNKLVGEMSAGQQRRIMIARALAGSHAAIQRHDASGAGTASDEVRAENGSGEMLLLDEPSNALDIAAQQDLRDLLQQLARQGTAIILITHHTADIIPEIGRVLLMSQGWIVGDGSRQQLLTGPVLSNLFGTSVTVSERDGFLHAW